MTVDALSARKKALAMRSKVLQSLRRFFIDRGFLETDTPVRIPVPALESHIDALPSGTSYLRTSPEFHMKRLICAGYERIFQIGPCFRKGELGRHHNTEFTMLEWYRTGAGYLDVLVDAKAMVAAVLNDVVGRNEITYQGRNIQMQPVWERLTVQEAFLIHAGWDPVARFDADRFDLDMVNKVEPGFPENRPTILMDYPAQAAALSRTKPGNPGIAERWELYAGGMELANAFSELTDPAEMRRRFAEWSSARRAAGREEYPADEEFLAALDVGMPECAGVALGVDRLVMLLADSARIEEVLPFCSVTP